MVPIGAMGSIQEAEKPHSICRKNLKRVLYVMADMAGTPDSAVHTIVEPIERYP